MFGKILVDDQEAQKSLSRTDKRTKTLGDRLRGGIKTAAKWGVALVGAATAVGAGMFALVNKATQTADAIAKGAEKLGVSTDAYQELEYWASQNGISHEQMEKAVGRFNQRLGQAVNGNEKYASALKALGVNLDEVRDGTLSTEDAYAQSIQTLSEMENEQDKVNLATELFGTRMARDLLPALNDGSLSIEEAKEKAQELGLVLSEDQLKASEQFQDSWDDIKRSLGTAATQIGLDLMPMFQSIMDWVIEKLPVIRETFSNVFGFIQDATGWVVDGIQKIIDFVQTWTTDNQSKLSGLWEVYQEYLLLIKDYVLFIFETIKTIIQEVLEAVVPFIQEKLTQIMQFWDENGQQIMEAVLNVFNFIKATIEFVMPAIKFIIEQVWGIIKGIFNGALNVIMGLIKTFSGLFTGDWSKMWEGIKQLLKGALEFVWNLISITLIGRGIALIRNFAKLGISLFRNFGSSIVGFFKNMGSSVTSTVSSLFSRVVGIFRNMSSSIRSVASGILSNVKSAFRGILSFITGLGGSFYSAGRGLIDQIVRGIKGAISKVTGAVKGVANKIRNFLPFSPAKEGPLSDLDKLDFAGPISDSIEDGEHEVQAKMEHLLDMPKQDNGSTPNNNTNEKQPVIININAKGTSDDELDRIFNYVNRRFGMGL